MLVRQLQHRVDVDVVPRQRLRDAREDPRADRDDEAEVVRGDELGIDRGRIRLRRDVALRFEQRNRGDIGHDRHGRRAAAGARAE